LWKLYYVFLKQTHTKEGEEVVSVFKKLRMASYLLKGTIINAWLPRLFKDGIYQVTLTLNVHGRNSTKSGSQLLMLQ
jgi:hypothetical protein